MDAELKFDKTLADIPFNAAFVAKNGFAGIKQARMWPDGRDNSFACHSLITDRMWSVPGNVEVCEVTAVYPNLNLAFAAGALLERFYQKGMIEPDKWVIADKDRGKMDVEQSPHHL